MYYTYPGIMNSEDYVGYVKKKFLRLMPSYFLFALIVFFVKSCFKSLAVIDNPIETDTSLYEIIIRPTASFAGSLWYVFVLFEYYLVIPLILLIIRSRIEVLVILAIPLHFINFPELAAINFFFKYLIFFALGMYAIKRNTYYLKIIDTHTVLFSFIFLIAIVLFYLYPLPKIVMGIIAVPALHGIVRHFLKNKKGWLNIIGEYSFSIYLMNTLVIGSLKAIGFKFLGWSYSSFALPALIMIISAIVIPILLKKYLINHLPFGKEYIG